MPGDEIRGTGGKGYAHRFCAPNLDDLHEWGEDWVRLCEKCFNEGRTVRVVAETARHGAVLAPYVERLLKIAPDRVRIDPAWREWLPDVPESQFRGPEDQGEKRKKEGPPEEPPQVSEPPEVSNQFWSMLGARESEGSAALFKELRSRLGKDRFLGLLEFILGRPEERELVTGSPEPLAYLRDSILGNGSLLRRFEESREETADPDESQESPAAPPPPPAPAQRPKCVKYNPACPCPDCGEFRSRLNFLKETHPRTHEDILMSFCGPGWKKLGSFDKGGHATFEARYAKWKEAQKEGAAHSARA